MILNKVCKPFFHCKDFIILVYNLHLTHPFLLALEIIFKRGLYLNDEGYDPETNYYLLQPLKRTTHIYLSTAVAKTSFDLIGLWESGMHAFTSTPKGRPSELLLQQMTYRCLSFGDAPPPAVDPNDDEDAEEEHLFAAPLDDSEWSEKPIPERDLCIHIVKRAEASYPS